MRAYARTFLSSDGAADVHRQAADDGRSKIVTLLALSGLYYAGYFFPNYQDSLIYDNSPQDFLRQMPDDHPYWHIYRQRRIVMCVGQGAWEDELLDSTRQMDALLKEKNVPAWIDYWGYDSAHDWAWWRKQIVYFMDHLLTEETVGYLLAYR